MKIQFERDREQAWPDGTLSSFLAGPSCSCLTVRRWLRPGS